MRFNYAANTIDNEYVFSAYDDFSSAILEQPPTVGTYYELQFIENETPFPEDAVVDFYIA